MILPFIRYKIDKNGLCNGAPVEEMKKLRAQFLIRSLKENLVDTEEMIQNIGAEQLYVDPPFDQYFNDHDAYYAFLQLTHVGESNGYFVNWKPYCFDDDQEWVQSWVAINENGEIDLLESAMKFNTKQKAEIEKQ